MAISKILHMKDSGNSFHARHLKRALDYVMNPEKTQGGRLVGAINCQADMAFEQMMDMKGIDEELYHMLFIRFHLHE